MTASVDPPAGFDLAEAEHARIFREAQRATDVIFSHYQLSQLLASHVRAASMAEAVVDELLHVCDAAQGGIWLAQPMSREPRLLARAGDAPMPSARQLAARAAQPQDGTDPWVVIELEEVGLLALSAGDGKRIDAGARRFLSLVRHELAGALRSAQLRETLELERTELSAVIENASDAIVVFDAERRVVRANPAAERLFAHDARAFAAERCSDLYACEVLESLGRCARCPLERVLDGGGRIDGEERVVVNPSGAGTAVVVNYAGTQRTTDGRARAVAILRDTSELARLAELRRGFLASVSHELRSPIALIKGYLETLLHLQPDAISSRGYLERMEAATDRLGHLVEQILDATQLAAGQLHLDLDELDLAGLVREAAEQAAAGGPPEMIIEMPLPLVRGDRERLRQVIENLVGNAQKYGERTAIAIQLRMVGEMAEVRVSDGGIGIPADERELVFEQFHRARNVREHGVPGSGLGLAISRRIVEAHGGTLGFDPAAEARTIAVLRLPIDAGRDRRPGPATLTVEP